MTETTTTTELPIANPRQFTEAWGSQVAGTNRSYVLREWADYGHRCTVPDPTYYRQQDGWNRASETTNPAAIRAMRKGLQLLGVRAPDDVEAAWSRNENRSYAIARVKDTVNQTLHAARLDADLDELLDTVIVTLSGLRTSEARDG